MDASLTRIIRDEVNAALAAVAAKRGLKIHAGNASYTDSSVTFKLECSEVSSDGIVLDKYAAALKSLAGCYELPADCLGRRFAVNGKIFKACGLNPRRAKPFMAVNEATGTTHIFPITPALTSAILKGV